MGRTQTSCPLVPAGKPGLGDYYCSSPRPNRSDGHPQIPHASRGAPSLPHPTAPSSSAPHALPLPPTRGPHLPTSRSHHALLPRLVLPTTPTASRAHAPPGPPTSRLRGRPATPRPGRCHFYPRLVSPGPFLWQLWPRVRERAAASSSSSRILVAIAAQIHANSLRPGSDPAPPPLPFRSGPAEAVIPKP